MKKMINLVVAFTMVIGMFAISQKEVAAASVFSDVKTGSWAENSINLAVSKGYVEGYPGGLFKPDANVTRAEFMKMVVSALGKQVDTGSGKWYTGYVAAAKEDKLYVAADFADSDAQWNKEMTRAEMARVAARAVGETTKENTKWMYLATKKGLITGIGAGKLGESEKTTRAQSVTIIERILSVNSGKTLPVDKYAVSSAEIAWHGTNIFTVMPEVFVDKKVTENVEELWKQENMTITSKDGNWKGQVEAVIAIDLADPKDPNLKLLGDLNELKWMNYFASDTKGIPVSMWKNSYVIYFKSKVIHNKDSKSYNAGISYVPFSLGGMLSPDRNKFVDGELNANALLFKKKPFDFPALIIPKTGWEQNSTLRISINVPSFSSYNNLSQDMISLTGPKYK